MEIALAIVLVAGAGWLVRGFAGLRTTDLGFVRGETADLRRLVPGREDIRTAIRSATSSQQLVDRLAALPGVTAVGATSNFPLRNTPEGLVDCGSSTASRSIPLHPIGTRQRFVSTGYFTATGTRILKGRDFGPDDRPNTTPVAIINQAFVKRYLAGREPIGLRFSAGYPAPDPRNEVLVVGVVEDVRQKSVSDEAEPAFYAPLTQVPLRRQTVVVATSRERHRRR